MKTLAFAFIIPVLLTACKDRRSNPVTQVQEAAKETDLQRTWESDCSTRPIDAVVTGLMSGGQASIKGMRTQYKFTGANVIRKTILFNHADCSGEAYVFEESGDFKIHEDQKTTDGGKAIDMNFHSVKVTISDDVGATAANAISLCRRNNWARGDSVDVTSVAEDATCYNAQVPRTNYNIYRVDGNHLYLGSSGVVAGNQRPATLNFAYKYHAK